MHILSVLTSQNGTGLWVFGARMVQFKQVPPTCLQSPLPLTSLPPIIPTLICVIIEQSPGRTVNSLVHFVLKVKQYLQVA